MKKPALSRESVLATALSLAETEGLSAVTIRRLATEFGVTPMAMYWHFANKEELLAALGQAVIAELELPGSGSAGGAAGSTSRGVVSDWASGAGQTSDVAGAGVLSGAESTVNGVAQASLTELLTALVSVLRRHPAVAPLVPSQFFAEPRGLELTEQALALLAQMGFSAAEAANIARTALELCVMLVVGEPGREIGMDECAREEHLAGKVAVIRSLPADRYPSIIAAAEPLTRVADVEEFYRGSIELFVAGVEARARGLGGVSA